MPSPRPVAAVGPRLPPAEGRAAVRPSAVADAAAIAVKPLVHGSFLLFVLSIPFEFPDRSFPIEIPTATACVFLLATLVQPRVWFARVPQAVVWFLAYLYMFWVAAAANGGDHAATVVNDAEYWQEVIKQFLTFLQMVLVCWAASNLLRNPKVARSALVTLACACAVRALLPLIGIGKTVHVQWGGSERVTALGQNANNSAMILAAGLLVLIGLRYRANRPRSLLRWLTWPFVALIAISIIDTGSRGGLVALGAGLLTFAFGRGRPWVRIRNAFVAAFAIGVVIFASFHSDVMRTRFEETLTSGALAGRERIYPALLEMFKEKPVVGWGPVNNKYELGVRLQERLRRRRDAHNIVLEVLTATGLLAAIPFFVGIGLCGRAAWRARHGADGVLPLALFISVMTANMSGDWIAAKILWLVLAYGLASDRVARAAVRRVQALRPWQALLPALPAPPVPPPPPE